MMLANVLFRGMTIETDSWVYGYFVNCRDEYCSESDTIPEIISLDAERIYRGEYDWFNSFAVNLDTVSQWTGILDKNGAKIFGGDLLSINNSKEEGMLVEVVWDSDALRWICKFHGDTDEFPYYFHPLNNNPAKYEVVGNIWDND